MKKALFLSAFLLLAVTCIVQAQQTPGQLPWKRGGGTRLHQPAQMLPAILQKQTSLVTKQRLDSNTNEMFQGTWDDDYKTIYTYDPQQRITDIVNYSYNTGPNPWVPEDKETFVYNTAGLLESSTTYDWDASLSQWIGNTRDVWVYDLSGKILIQTSLFWDLPTSNWVPSSKGDYSYNSNNLVSNIIWSHYDADSSQWYTGSKEERTYNGSNQLTLALFSWWDDQSSVFQPGSKDEYTWHTNGKISTKLSSMYDSWMMTWTPEFKEEYTYDANGNKTMLVYYQYDWGTQQMLPYQKEEQTFNSLNNLTEEKVSYYNLSTTSWDLNSRMTFVFNDTYAFNDLILPFSNGGYLDIAETFMHMLVSYNQFNYNSSTQAWEDIYRGTMHWSQQVISGIDKAPAMGIKLYPNPAGNQFFIETSSDATLRITDLKGSMVQQISIPGAGKHNIETQLVPGIYIYTLNTGNQDPGIGKLIIR